MKTLCFSILLATNVALAQSSISTDELTQTLRDHCNSNKEDFWVKNSESCRLVEGKYKLNELCEGYSRANQSIEAKLRSIAEKYAELKKLDAEQVLIKVCSIYTGVEAISAKPECKEEIQRTRQIKRKWWNGKSWVSTQDNIQDVKNRANKGDRAAQYNLGVWYFESASCVARDVKIAAPYLCKAYDSGEAMAGLIFQSEYRHPSDQKAREIFGKNNGCELTGRQVVQAAEAKKLAEQAQVNLKKANAGDLAAMLKIGETYMSDDLGLKQDFNEAFKWFNKAAQKGNAEAMSALGGLYSLGAGVEKNVEKAFEWALKAAKKGDVDAMYFVGLNYYDGQGTEENLTKAVQWLSKAMDSGHAEAKDKLVEMYLSGELQSVAFKSLSERLKRLEKTK